MASQLLPFCVQSELVCQLDRLVGAKGRDRACHLQSALERYVKFEMAHVQAYDRDQIRRAGECY